MCAIIGALVWGLVTPERLAQANDTLNHLMRASHERGRDGRGFMVNSGSMNDLEDRDVSRSDGSEVWDLEFFGRDTRVATFISNLRAEPTTEYVERKETQDQQPYTAGDWSIVHNGTIANDKELRTHKLRTRIDSAAIAEVLDAYPVFERNINSVWQHFLEGVESLKGSYAILAAHAAQWDHLMVAANYRPVWYAVTDFGVFFASARHYFPKELTPRMLDPYSAQSFSHDGHKLHVRTHSLLPAIKQSKALVVCSGGLDSVVAATYVKRILGMQTELIHFRYGSRAEGPEVAAVQAAAAALGVPCTVFPLPVYKPGDSPLLQADSKIAGGEAGAEFAHEWVPARNLLLLSVATAFAEANGFDIIALGNNLEEAGAYPDNEPEFITRFNDLLPFAVGDGKSVRVIMPVGNMMKHEIVKLGHQIDAPLHLTWSCYRAGEQHCGTCGPCYMRRTAFQINNIPEVITYKDMP